MSALAIQTGMLQAQEAEFLKFGVDTKIEYTDNRDSVQAAEDDNIDFYISPRVDAYLNTGPTLTDFFYQPSFRYRSDAAASQNDEEIFHRVGVAVTHSLTRQVEIRAREEFTLTDDPSIEDGGTTVRDDQTHYINKAGATVKYDPNRSTFLEFSVDHEMKRFEEDIVARESDEDRLRGKARIFKTIDETLGVDGQLSYSSYEFDTESGINRDFDVIIAAAGARKSFSQELRAGASVGITSTSYDDGALGDDVGPYVNVDVTAAPTPAFRLNGAVLHSVRESDAFPFASQTFTELRARAELAATEAIDVGLTGTFRISEYDDDNRPGSAPATAFATGATSGDEDTTVVTAFAEWHFSDQSKLRIAQVYEDVESDIETSFTKNTSTAEVHVEF